MKLPGLNRLSVKVVRYGYGNLLILYMIANLLVFLLCCREGHYRSFMKFVTVPSVLL